MNLLSLPSDILLYQLTLLSIDDINNICLTNSIFAKLINKEYLW